LIRRSRKRTVRRKRRAGRSSIASTSRSRSSGSEPSTLSPRGLVHALAPGSYLAITHPTADFNAGAIAEAVAAGLHDALASSEP
jgi:hypothetical protein